MEVPPPGELDGPDRRGPAAGPALASDRALAEWANRVRAEYRSAAHTAQVVHLVIACGMDESLATTGLRIVQDELDHARLSHAVLVSLGGSDVQIPVDAGELSRSAMEGPLATLVDAAGSAFCLGETFAVPLFAAMRAGTTWPEARAALDRVLKDEAVHRQFGWDLLDGLLLIDEAGVRERLESKLPGWLRGFRRAYGRADAGQAITAEERAVGLLDLAEYQEIHDRCLAEDIAPRFAKRGIVLPED